MLTPIAGAVRGANLALRASARRGANPEDLAPRRSPRTSRNVPLRCLRLCGFRPRNPFDHWRHIRTISYGGILIVGRTKSDAESLRAKCQVDFASIPSNHSWELPIFQVCSDPSVAGGIVRRRFCLQGPESTLFRVGPRRTCRQLSIHKERASAPPLGQL